MILSLNTGLSSLSMQRSLSNSTSRLNDSMKRLSSGVKINNASDGAANFILSKGLETKTSGLSVATNNIKTALGSLYTIDGYYKGIVDSLHRSRDLAVQSANAPYSTQERSSLNANATEMHNEVTIAQNNANSESNPVSGGGGTGDFLNLVTQIDEAQAIANGYDANHIIKSASEFVSKISADLSGDFILTDDLNMSELGTLTNSAITSTFTGELDGNGHVIENLTIDTGASSPQYIGLFTRSTNATIKNLGIENSTITASNSHNVSCLVGYASSSDLTNCYIKNGNIADVDMHAGLLTSDLGEGSTVSSCYAEGRITGNDEIGGLVGWTVDSSINNSYSDVDITSGDSAGGFSCMLQGTTISNCYSKGSVTADYTGGFVGMSVLGSSITNCYSTADTIGTSTSGFAGANMGTIETCYSTGLADYGFIMSDSGTINNSYWDTEKSGTSSSNGGEGKTTAEMDAIIATASWPVYEVAQAPVDVSEGFTVQIGNDGTNESLYNLGDLSIDLSSLSIDLSTIASSKTSIESIDEAINYMTERRAYIGAGISSLEGMTSSNQQKETLLNASNSTIKDTDFGYDTSRMLQQQILQQSTISLMQQSQKINADVLIGLLNF